ncbi:MAG: efflux transporter outer membrane subunit [Desulfobulbus sp.]|jgi:multidrug efflux system outer membrane protein|uniref:efflux transporter outer membrane subunit n=1 Tax=Desulfobulbus sp. TaxID=895 RepID=UPI00283CB3E3|nr:efflux transporter outer membrane subunit [Desulfobulbus sp.]MDR2549933.1 efflux transporter outer membrane subunit [Desulfobulbus sp.]
MRNLRFFLILALAMGGVAGCTVGPDYKRPAVDVPTDWRLPEQEARQLADTDWWRQFNDPVLDRLIATALQENKDLLIAAARIEEFAGRYGIVRADLFPQIGASADYTRQRVTETGENQLVPGYKVTTNSFSAALNASWEIDLWGRIRRSTEAARAQLIASEEGRRAVVLTLVSNVAGAYINLRDLDRQLEISRNTAKSRGESYALFQERFNGGIVSDLELSQNRSQYQEALASIPPLEKAIAQQENSLCVLLGRNPGPIARGKTIDELILPAVIAGIPSDLLERRPDIRQAEQNLIAANAQIGVAKAAYFPTISLTGALGTASGELSDLFKGPSRIWQYSVPVAMPIFTAGKIAGSVREAEALQQQALLGYQQAIQNGFREVNDALVAQQQTDKQLETQKSQVAALRQYADIARLRYDNGYTDFLTVLDAERSLFSAELSYAQTQGELHLARIALYKAVGGGWVDKADALSRPLPAETAAEQAKTEKSRTEERKKK